jgi:hypothetical protein
MTLGFWARIDKEMNESAIAYYARREGVPRQHNDHVHTWRAVEWAKIARPSVLSEGRTSAGRE